ncbi:YrrS family protein [Litchfieldia salsa]|uniref:DUF1510 domain-containing protein n=1 Tax=Litchfieldia salsa TaxID=930152 RepID=A0A1H0V771_9BACI|nr:YrrS family protein [Litchfieldia salsa]SDP74392.1 Protein of unknown function [Litchfieldia salsa]
MGYDLEKLVEGPRSEKLSKRRRINRILNILIGIVFVLILFFGWKFLLSSNNQESVSGQVEETQDSTNTTEPPVEEDTALGSDDSETEEEPVEEVVEAPEGESTEHEEVTDGDPESNIIRSIKNKAWKPVGTNQTGPHTIVYDKGTPDRLEMEQAISYALGYENSSDLTVWELARDAENRVAATISTKDNSRVYRVYIEWVNEKGWMPLKIDELRKNDSKYYTGSSTNESSTEEDSEE